MAAPEPPAAPENAHPMMVCAGCGTAVAALEPYPFRCPTAVPGDDIDHVLHPVLPHRPSEFPAGADRHPFLAYRELLFSYQSARARGMSDELYTVLVRELDDAIAGVDGHGFWPTPFEPNAALGDELRTRIWIKDETGNVSGSHKGRHLMGVMVYLRALEQLAVEGVDSQARLAVASCGNAALAAAVIARAAGRALDTFVPPSADPAVRQRLERLGAHLVTCPREDGDAGGDPCVQRFRVALTRGALPFGCQGSENGLAIEGGQTLGYEIATELSQRGEAIDALFVQVGGGALATACIRALRDARELGALRRLPRIHAVQSAGTRPLERAYHRVAERVADRLGIVASDPRERALAIADRSGAPEIGDELDYAARHRSAFMWPWETEPVSYASGILDDETYDWLAVVAGMLETGGYPIAADEPTLHSAHELAHRTTGIPVCPTGTAGLAGILGTRGEAWQPGETLAVIFSGTQR